MFVRRVVPHQVRNVKIGKNKQKHTFMVHTQERQALIRTEGDILNESPGKKLASLSLLFCAFLPRLCVCVSGADEPANVRDLAN